jgi:hypothetical protein
MTRYFVGPVFGLLLVCLLRPADGAARGRGGERPPGESSAERKPGREQSRGESDAHGNSKKPPGGSWSEDSHDAHGQSENSQQHKGAEGAAAENRKSPQTSGAEGVAAGAAASKNKQPNYSGAEGAAAGAAASKNKQPNYSGAEGAAAGAAAENRKAPQATGAQGAAAGAAVAKNKQPNYSGAQGAAAGAAIENRNAPNYSGAEGAAAGAAVARNNQPQFSGAQGAAAGAAVRSSFDHPEIYGQQWYGEHSGIWAPAGLAAGAAWAPSSWGTIANTCGYSGGTPVSYNYGANVTCKQGNVLVDGQDVGTAEEFSQQASDLAETGAQATPTDDEQWLPLGVYAMVRNENQHPQLILQLAINKQGILRGNYTDEVTDNTLPIQGAVDQQTQRAAWTVGDNKSSVMEAGLANLTDSEARALLHKNGKTARWLLVRLNQPDQAKN